MRALAFSLLAWIALPAQAAEPISNARAAEYALHRIERLVILRKIDATHQSRFEGLEVANLPAQQPTDPAFQIRAFQVAGADASRMTVDLVFDQLGRPISHVQGVGSASMNPPAWPQKDPVTIAEEALHVVEERGPVVDELRPFYESMTRLLLSPVTDDQGALSGGEVTITIAEDKPSLVIAMGLDAVFKSYRILPAVADGARP